MSQPDQLCRYHDALERTDRLLALLPVLGGEDDDEDDTLPGGEDELPATSERT